MSAQPNDSRPPQRFHDLDALRALAMFLVILLHVGFFVQPEPWHLWPLHDSTATGEQFYKLFVNASASFAMSAFFLLSGYFTVPVWERRGSRALVMERLQRIGIPFLAGCVIIIPLHVWIITLIKGGWDYPYWVLPLVWLFGTTAHLWFLWYLLLLTATFVILVKLGVRFSRPAIWWLALPLSVVCSLLMVEARFMPDFAVKIVPEPAHLGYYTLFYFFGAFMHRRGMVARPWWTVALIGASATFVVGTYLLNQYHASYGDTKPENAYLFKNSLTAAAAVFKTAYAWLACFGMMGLFSWVAARERFWVRYLADTSYWMYLTHLPLVLLGHWLVIDWPIHYHLKFLLVCAGVALILLLAYQFGVRYTIIGRTLNGRRAPRRRPPSPAPAQAD